jgi:putative salt-induced outer membrane protein
MSRFKYTPVLGLCFVLLILSFQASASNDILKKLYLKEKKLKQKSQGLSLSGEFGMLAASGNTNTTTFKAALTSEHEMRRWSNNYHSEIVYKQNKTDTDTIVTAQRFLASAQLDYKLPSKNNRYLFMQNMTLIDSMVSVTKAPLQQAGVLMLGEIQIVNSDTVLGLGMLTRSER